MHTHYTSVNIYWKSTSVKEILRNDPLDSYHSVGPYVFELQWINQTVGCPLQHIHLMTAVADRNHPGKLFWAIHTFYELQTSQDSRWFFFGFQVKFASSTHQKQETVWNSKWARRCTLKRTPLRGLVEFFISIISSNKKCFLIKYCNFQQNLNRKFELYSFFLLSWLISLFD